MSERQPQTKLEKNTVEIPVIAAPDGLNESLTNAIPRNIGCLGLSSLLSLAQAAKLIPTSNGRPPSTATLWRWCTKGFTAKNGQNVKLMHFRFGRRIAIEPEALKEFARVCAEAWSPAKSDTPAARYAPQKRKRPTSNDNPERQRQIAEACARMRALCGKK